MRGTIAKKLRKKVYGTNDFRKRKYDEIVKSSYVWMGKEHTLITQVSDKTRRWYQNAKKVYNSINKNKEKKNDQNEVI